jgi:TM2 domain-containing membrane protein YozV
MFCRNCGKEVDEKAVACTSCGVPPKKGTKFCQNCGQPTNDMAEVCTSCGVKLTHGVNLGTIEDAFAPGANKSKVVAGVLGILLGYLGIHRFYLGYTTMGIIQIAVTIVTCGFGGLWGFVEGILILVGSTITTDAQGNPLV